MRLRRRDFVGLAVTLPLAATPQAEESAASGEGPFYKPGAPLKTTLVEPGIDGTPLVISGRVVNTMGQPVANAVLDIWHADSTGTYDNTGFKLRGRIAAGPDGRYEIRTIQPVPYGAGHSMRAAHIHLKVSGDRTRVLTTEVYFKGDKYEKSDGMVKTALQVDLIGGDKGRPVRLRLAAKRLSRLYSGLDSGT